MARKQKSPWSKRRKITWVLIGIFFICYIGLILWHTYKPLPNGISYAGDLHKTDSIQFLTDLTYAQDKQGNDMVHENNIFEEIYKTINEAEEFVVLDFFLVDGYYDEEEDFPQIVETLSTTVANKKKQNPEMPIVFITDPLNRGYGSYENEWFKKMRDAGVEIVYTDLDPLRDSTPIYSGIYRLFFQWFDFGGKGWIANAMASDAPKMTIASYMTLLNVKANHRKVLITEKSAIVSSANPHDASGFHGNIALKLGGPVLNDMLKAEEAVSLMSGGPKLPRVETKQEDGKYTVQYLTEKKILDALLGDLSETEQGDTIWLGMFFLSERAIMDELINATNRGVEVNLILDPNENSFGRQKSGIPNRPVVQELLEDTENKMNIRWYNTVIGQYHTKAIWIQTKDHTIISNGAANFTERALNDYNLESNIRVIAPNNSDLAVEMEQYFERLWNNEDAMYTLDASEYQNTFTWWQRWIVAFQSFIKVTTY